MSAKDGGAELAKLMDRHLDCKVDPVALRLFIVAYWSRVSLCVHAIHDET